jgi:adenylyltransferase/sulfurtransferase
MGNRPDNMPNPSSGRYSRQVRFAPLGEAGQERLRASRAVLIGAGALGAAQANALVRAGLGFLRIVDRDFLELHNLPRQWLYDEQDIADNLPKAEAARRRLARINSEVTVEAVVADARFDNIESLAESADILLDGTDNFQTRYLINDLAAKTNRPWIYGGAVGATGLELAIIPGRTVCLRCLFEEAPPPGSTPTCETAGVLGPIAALVGELQATDAIKILSGHAESVSRRMTHIDGWSGRIVQLDVSERRPDCPCCGRRDFAFLAGRLAEGAVSLCGRTAVQIAAPTTSSAGPAKVDFARMAQRLGPTAKPTYNQFMLKFTVDEFAVTVFTDGRAIIGGTADPAVARSIYARYVGS